MVVCRNECNATNWNKGNIKPCMFKVKLCTCDFSIQIHLYSYFTQKTSSGNYFLRNSEFEILWIPQKWPIKISLSVRKYWVNSQIWFILQIRRQQTLMFPLIRLSWISVRAKMSSSQQQYCLKWNNHQSNMLRVFTRLLSHQHFTDVILCAEGKNIKCHKVSFLSQNFLTIVCNFSWPFLDGALGVQLLLRTVIHKL